MNAREFREKYAEKHPGALLLPLVRDTKPKRRRRDVRHEELVKAVIEWLKSQGVRSWRCDTGVKAIVKGDRVAGYRAYGTKGASDISGVMPGGRRLDVEVKTGSGRLSGAQVTFQDGVNDAGGLALVCRDTIESIAADIEAALQEAKQ